MWYAVIPLFLFVYLNQIFSFVARTFWPLLNCYIYMIYIHSLILCDSNEQSCMVDANFSIEFWSNSAPIWVAILPWLPSWWAMLELNLLGCHSTSWKLQIEKSITCVNWRWAKCCPAKLLMRSKPNPANRYHVIVSFLYYSWALILVYRCFYHNDSCIIITDYI